MKSTKTSKKFITYTEAFGKSLSMNMKKNSKIFISGLEVSTSHKVFRTLEIPYKNFPKRFIQTPAMESGLSNILAGAAISGMKPVFVHNRCDFLLLAFDSIVNVIDKWNYMFDGNAGNCPIVITAIIGKGWGQGATHSQTFHNFFSRLSGFDVFLPSFPSDVIGVVNYTAKSKRPAIIFKHRSLLNTKEKNVKKIKFRYGKAKIVQNGNDLAIITLSYGTILSNNIAKKIFYNYKKKITVLDLVSVNPLDYKTIFRVAKKHKKIIILDIDHSFSGISSEIGLFIYQKLKNKIIKKIGNLFTPTPTSKSLEDYYYPSEEKILKECCKMLNLPYKKKLFTFDEKKIDYKKVGAY